MVQYKNCNLQYRIQVFHGMTKENFYLGKEKEKNHPSDGCSNVLSQSTMPCLTFLFSHREEGTTLKHAPTLGTFTFQPFLKVMQNATPRVEAEMKMCAANITNTTLQK